MHKINLLDKPIIFRLLHKRTQYALQAARSLGARYGVKGATLHRKDYDNITTELLNNGYKSPVVYFGDIKIKRGHE